MKKTVTIYSCDRCGATANDRELAGFTKQCGVVNFTHAGWHLCRECIEFIIDSWSSPERDKILSGEEVDV